MTPRRPQRVLTETEMDRVRSIPQLGLHRALLLGLVDPTPNPSPMSEAAGEWVRAHAWPTWMRAFEQGYPFGYWRWSICERGTCWNCWASRCDLCVHRQQGRPSVDDNLDRLHNHRGHPIAPVIARPHEQECVWVCRCPCTKKGHIVTTEGDNEGEIPGHAVPRRRPAPTGIDPLFDLE
ncbi:DUF6248 family natural product biosynthesis protein [Nocardiopsis synnemataformans]|uniref:DUF6248 family natural product biosynthesis protein n=1 Tax=Nocardiopsis synnemataformans TaxID=61305 RepID=UPI003EBA3A7B